MGNTQVYALFSFHRYPQGGLSSQGLAIPRNKQPRQERAKGQQQTGQGPEASGPRANRASGEQGGTEKEKRGPGVGTTPTKAAACGMVPVGWTTSGDGQTVGLKAGKDNDQEEEEKEGTQEEEKRQKLTVFKNFISSGATSCGGAATVRPCIVCIYFSVKRRSKI